MKNILVAFFGFFLSLQVLCQQSTDTVISNSPENLRLKVLYFHITHRCNTCFSIEANVRKTLNDHFLKELETGVIDLYVMDCELPENKVLVTKYDAYGATLALTSYLNGAESETEDLTSWAFQKVHKPEIFISELKTKIEKFLK